MRWRRLWNRPCNVCGLSSVARISTLSGTYWLCRIHFEEIGANLVKQLWKSNLINQRRSKQ